MTERTERLIVQCCVCRRYRFRLDPMKFGLDPGDVEDVWIVDYPGESVEKIDETNVSHGYCPVCYKQALKSLE